MRFSPLAVFSALLLAGCASSSSRPDELPPTLVYEAVYEFALVTVHRPATTDNPEADWEAVDVSAENPYLYEDDLVSAILIAEDDRITFEVENLTEHSLKILWDDSAFIGADGDSSRIMHSGVPPAVRHMPLAPTVVPARSRARDYVVPANNVRYRSGFETASVAVEAGWENLPLVGPLVNEVLPFADEKAIPPANEAFVTQVEANVGKRFGLLLPLESQGVKREYTFWFEILNTRITGPKAL